MRLNSQSYSVTSWPTSSVFLIMGKPSTHTNILFWIARGIKSKKYEFINYLDTSRKVAGSSPDEVDFFILPAALWPWG
jgi:hypothetical protein